MKKLLSIALVFGLCCTAALAQEQEKKAGSSIAEWIKSLQSKIAQITPKKSVPMTTGVAGVRGAKEDSHVKLYWKGKKGDEAVTEAELSEFKTVIDSASGCDQATAAKEIEKFMAKYPDSPLIPDAKKTLDLVKAEVKEPAPAK